MTTKSKEGIKLSLALIMLITVLVGNLLACGVMVGRIDQKVETLKERGSKQAVTEEKQDLKIDKLIEDSAFMRGQLTTELQGLRRDMDRVITCIERLELVDGKASSP